MIINYKYIPLYVNTKYFDVNKQSVLFLHGFSGSSEDWDEIIPQLDKKFSYLSLDFIGHGKSGSSNKPGDYTVNEIVNQIHFILRYLKIKNPIIAGYSMGGRAALSFTVHHSNIVSGLILESTTPGLEDNVDKTNRVNDDLELARNLKRFGIEWFTNYWMNIPLFDSQKKLSEEKLSIIRQKKLKLNSESLANSLIGFSTGKMPSLWNSLKTLRQKTLLITGELDEKFNKINENIIKYKPNCEHKIISDVGHNTHLEKPQDFTILVNNFLRSL